MQYAVGLTVTVRMVPLRPESIALNAATFIPT